MNPVTIKQVIDQAGGPRTVGDRCKVSYQAVQKWSAIGLPRTEFTKETIYAQQICELAEARGHPIDPQTLLDLSIALRKSKAA